MALMMKSEAGPREPELDAGASPELAFSHQVAWVVAKPSRSGHIVTLSCSGRSHTWLSRDDGEQMSAYCCDDQMIFKDWIMLILTRKCSMCATSRPPAPA